MFDEIAAEYDHHRPAYPDALIDRACGVAGLARGARVLEIGCGTGQLTRSLLHRGLGVTALEPGEQLIARARDQLAGAVELQFVNARLEEARLPHARYQAVFSASAIHWVDPDVGWRVVADALINDGTLALVSYFGLEDSRSGKDQQAFRAALARVAPELALEWPRSFDLSDAAITHLFRAADRRRRAATLAATPPTPRSRSMAPSSRSCSSRPPADAGSRSAATTTSRSRSPRATSTPRRSPSSPLLTPPPASSAQNPRIHRTPERSKPARSLATAGGHAAGAALARFMWINRGQAATPNESSSRARAP
jgi:SAM-dependent methyltransferase